MAILTRLPLQRRIMVLVGGGLGVTLIVVAAVGIGLMAQSTNRVLQERLVMARVSATNLDERLTASMERLEGMAATTRWDLRAGLSGEARRMLTLSSTRPGIFSGGFVVIDAGRRILWPVGREGGLVNDATARRTLRGIPGVSGLARLPPTEDPAAIMWVPIRGPDGATAGALGGIIDLRGKALRELIKPLALGRTGHAVLVDADGIVLAGTDEHEQFTRGDHPDFFATLIRAHRADVAQTPEIVEGVPKELHVMAFAPLAAGNWGVGFGQAEWEVFLYERQLRWRILMLGLLLLGAGLWFAWRDTGVITTPLGRLTVSAQRIARGDLDSPIPTEPGHEVGMLAGALERMRTSLADMREEQQSHLAIIDRQGQQAHALYEVSRAILSEANLADVLATVAASARTLLRTEVSSVCLWDDAQRRLIPGAFDGPGGAFHGTDGVAVCEQFSPNGIWQPVSNCPFVRPEFRQMHVTAHLRAGDRLVGFMCVGCAEPRAFREEDANLLTSLASLAAIAVESAQLRERVQRLAVLEERERIGRDLHDSIMQSLYGISLALDHALQLLGSRPAQAASRLESAIGMVTQTISDVRSYVLGLHPRGGDDSLREALERVVREFRVNTLLPIELRAADDLPDLSADQRLHLKLLLREALANVARHAHATRVAVDAVVEADDLRVVIADDGHGFDPEQASHGEGLGLRTMAERARRLGGTCEVRSNSDAGTTVEVRLPRPAERRGVA